MIVLVNFGGPRNLEEIPIFLKTLLQDRDVVSTKFPTFLHNLLFAYVARKRAKKIAHDYSSIGGRSPIYFDTEEIAKLLSKTLNCSTITFHRYLPSTHAASLEKIETSSSLLTVLPLFPQFSYATTGSIARFFARHLSLKTLQRLRWIKSYAAHPAFIQAHVDHLLSFLSSHNLSPANTFFLFSCHGLPVSFISEGDIYQAECEASYQSIMKYFPNTPSLLCYQSKFGKGEWLQPYTDETCEHLSQKTTQKNIVVIPLSFTSDHIETLFEIESLYLPLLRSQNLTAYRCPALNLQPHWIQSLAQISQDHQWSSTQMLIKHSRLGRRPKPR